MKDATTVPATADRSTALDPARPGGVALVRPPSLQLRTFARTEA